MKHAIDTDHPAVRELLAENATGVVETLPIPENGCYRVESGRLHVGDTVHDVLRVNSSSDGAHTEILLIQPTTGVLSVATLTKAHSVSSAASFPESARVELLESASRLMRFENDSENDPVKLIHRDVVPLGDTSTIEGTMEILRALAERRGVGRILQRAIRDAAGVVRDALAIEEYERHIFAVRSGAEPHGEPRNRGVDALADALRTATQERHHADRRGHMHEGHPGWRMHTESDARRFLSMAGNDTMFSVDGGPPRPASEIVISYGDEGSPYRLVTVDGKMMEGVPLFTNDVCVVEAGGSAVTLRIVKPD